MKMTNQTSTTATAPTTAANISDKISKVQDAVSQFGFTATVASNDLIIVRTKKGLHCANVTANGVEQKYAGQKNLCGALARNAIAAATA